MLKRLVGRTRCSKVKLVVFVWTSGSLVVSLDPYRSRACWRNAVETICRPKKVGAVRYIREAVESGAYRPDRPAEIPRPNNPRAVSVPESPRPNVRAPGGVVSGASLRAASPA